MLFHDTKAAREQPVCGKSASELLEKQQLVLSESEREKSENSENFLSLMIFGLSVWVRGKTKNWGKFVFAVAIWKIFWTSCTCKKNFYAREGRNTTFSHENHLQLIYSMCGENERVTSVIDFFCFRFSSLSCGSKNVEREMSVVKSRKSRWKIPSSRGFDVESHIIGESKV